MRFVRTPLSTTDIPVDVIRYYVDGGLLGRKNPCPEGVYWSVFCQKPGERWGQIITRRQPCTDFHTNQDAEWLAVRGGLRHALERFPGQAILIHSDSQFVVKQFDGLWRIKIERHFRLAHECFRLAGAFPWCRLLWKPRQYMVERLGH